MKANLELFLQRLAEQGGLAADQAQKLQTQFARDPHGLLQHLCRIQAAPREILGRAWADSLGLAYVNLEKTVFQQQVVQKLPQAFARKHVMIPLYAMDGVTTVACAAPADIETLHAARQVMGLDISPVFSFADQINDAIEIYYQSGEALGQGVVQLNEMAAAGNEVTADNLKRMAGNQAVVEFCRGLLLLAVKERASDIHIDPQEDNVFVRFRVDGVLLDRMRLEKALHSPLVSRLKVTASLDITERRRPQDGRLVVELATKSLDFRVSIVPTIYGEKIVLRALGQIHKNEVPDLNELGLSAANCAMLRRIVESPNGIFFVTGPTGSGKSTTLFSVLKHLNKPEINILTAEDPVEYRLPRINQVQVNSELGMDFNATLRSFLRQDPDVILIGEIRDLDTARTAAQAALTGHLVLATMHTNNSLQAISRLIEIGVEPFLVAPSMIGVMAQRLVRRVCRHCKEAYRPAAAVIEKYFEWDGETEVAFYRGAGCSACNQLGYFGRIPIHELFLISDQVRSLIANRASILDLEETARWSGFKTMRYDGLKKVLMGLTTIEEIERVTAAIG